MLTNTSSFARGLQISHSLARVLAPVTSRRFAITPRGTTTLGIAARVYVPHLPGVKAPITFKTRVTEMKDCFKTGVTDGTG